MDNDNPGKRRQRLKELRAQGGGEGRVAQRRPGGRNDNPGGGRRQRAGGGRGEGQGRGAGGGEGRLLERFPKLREAMAARGNGQGGSDAPRGEGAGKPMLRELIKRRRSGAGGNQGDAKRQIKPLSELDEQQLQQRVDKLQAKLDEARQELDALRERKARDEAPTG